MKRNVQVCLSLLEKKNFEKIKRYIRYDMDETRYRDVFRYDEGTHR